MAAQYFITAIHTDSGKTLVSAIFAQALHADYWKPIQAGYPRDTDTVKGFMQNKKIQGIQRSLFIAIADVAPCCG